MQISSTLLLISALCLVGSGSVSANPDNCIGYSTPQLVPIKNNCYAYYDCRDGSGLKKNCPRRNTFNYITGACQIGKSPCYGDTAK
ncbi:hypothetical protein BDF21DRAFT_89538 [Thamnidium elegans]|nr:hypothetical protein BDF21DRAFT_89538 [Thamnidium elegans]